jgi:hypothetical protein
LGKEHVVDETIKHCLPITGGSFGNSLADDILIPRLIFDLSLFEINLKSIALERK